MRPIRTFGHGTLEANEIVEVLRTGGIELIVDVRRYPGSRRNPQVGRDALAEWLPEAGIGYRWLPELGGRRRPRPDSPHVAWRVDQFRAYADHMESEEFAEGLATVLELAEEQQVAVMCSEAVWWRCHRRLVADHLVLVEQRAVEHLFHDGRLVPHDPLAEAREDHGRVVYDVVAEG